VTVYIDILTSLTARCSTVRAQLRRDFSLTLYFRLILIATIPICRYLSKSKYTPGVGTCGARLKAALWADQ